MTSPASNVVSTLTLALGAVGGFAGLAAVLIGYRHQKELNDTKANLQILSSGIDKKIHDLSDQAGENLKATEKVRDHTLAALSLNQAILDDSYLNSRVRTIIANFHTALQTKDPLFILFARRALQRAQEQIGMDSQRKLRIDSNPYDTVEFYATELLAAANKTDEFWACSLVDPDFWDRAAGYIEQHRVKKDVANIKRLFVFGSDEAFREERSQHQMGQQIDWGVEVRYLIDPSLDGISAQQQDWDMVLLCRKNESGKYEDIYAARFKVNSDKTIDHIDILAASETDGNVRRLAARIRQLWDIGIPYQKDGAINMDVDNQGNGRSPDPEKGVNP